MPHCAVCTQSRADGAWTSIPLPSDNPVPSGQIHQGFVPSDLHCGFPAPVQLVLSHCEVSVEKREMELLLGGQGGRCSGQEVMALIQLRLIPICTVQGTPYNLPRKSTWKCLHWEPDVESGNWNNVGSVEYHYSLMIYWSNKSECR